MESQIKTLLFYAKSESNESLSYHHGWPVAFEKHERFNCTFCNLKKSKFHKLKDFIFSLLQNHDAIVILHSTYSNSNHLPDIFQSILGAVSTPKVYFIGNEYKLMPNKMAFCEKINIDLLISQTDDPDVHHLYRERLGVNIEPIPNTGLNTKIFEPGPPREERDIDIGYRAYPGPRYLGHRNREELYEAFSQSDQFSDLTKDLSLDRNDRFDVEGWASFLQNCKAQIGTEAGTDIFELDDKTRKAVNKYVNEHESVSWDELNEKFFRSVENPTPCRMISGRHIEAAGTKTTQLLVEGNYNNYLQPDEHYIPIKKDFSNLKEAREKFDDQEYCKRITNNAYEIVREKLTYKKLLDKFTGYLEPVLNS